MKTITPTISNLRMLASIKGERWMIRPDKVDQFALSALEVPEKKAEFDMEDFYPMRTDPYIDSNGIGHVEIKGALLNQCPGIYEKIGLATTYETIIEEAQEVVGAGAKAILFHVDSPGGAVSGNIEACHALVAILIPTASYSKTMACSAAYKLVSSTGLIVASYSAEMGNIGAILSWPDCNEMWKQMGIEWKALVNEGADLKSTFHLEPDETQIAFLQESINEAGAEFRSWVEANRIGINPEVFRAGWYSGERAESLGLIDGIGTEQDACDWLISQMAGAV